MAGQSRRIGLLGGAFNPPHAGHLHIAQTAMKRLRLDAVWWLLRASYPHKLSAPMTPLHERMALVAALIGNRRAMMVSNMEDGWRTLSTFDVARQLLVRAPNARFVLILGADQWAWLHTWIQWQRLVALLPMLVFDRPTHRCAAINSPAGISLARRRIGEQRDLLLAKPPAWRMCFDAKLAVSSSLLRGEKSRH